MIKNKKLALLSVTGLLGALAIGAVATKGTGVNIIPTLGDDATVWVHYNGKAATDSSYGVKEYWASCSPDANGNYGTRVFEAPTTGTIKETKNVDDTLYQYIGEHSADDDRYIAPLDSTIKFDARGGADVTEGKYSYGTLASKLPTTTRAGDDYYETYTFGGWYKDGVAYDEVAGSTTVKAKWNYGNAKKVYLEDWIADNFTKGDSVTIKNNTDVSGFSADEKGVMFAPSDSAAGTMAAPLTNFNELLKTRRAIYMYVGGFNSHNKMNVEASSGSIQLFDNGSTQDVKNVTRMLLRFAKEGDGKVHMHYSDTTAEKPSDSKAADVTLSDEQAAGTASLVFTASQQGASRLYWIGQPYYINGEEKYLDVTQKTGFTVTNADLKKKDEVSGARPWGAWTEWVGGLNEYIGIDGNAATQAATLTFDNINFASLFTEHKGVRFTIGLWNGDTHVYFGGTDLGLDGTKPDNPNDHTYDSVAATWHNWEVSIDDIGAHIYNNNEDETYDVPLTADQLAGKEGISLQLTKDRSNGYFFLLSNLYTYHF